MTHDFSNVEVGDKVSFSYNGVVAYTTGQGQKTVIIFSDGSSVDSATDNIENLNITKPLPPLPTTEGSAVLCKDNGYDRRDPFVVVLESDDYWWDVNGGAHTPKDYTILYDAGAIK